jgi:hypothetical protein
LTDFLLLLCYCFSIFSPYLLRASHSNW